MRKFIKLLVLFLAASPVFSQSNQVSGRVISHAEFPSIALLKGKDSSVVKVTVPDAQGSFNFESITDGNYIIMASASGYEPAYSSIIAVPDASLKSIEINVNTKKLSGVTITARRPVIELRVDRTIVNVDASPINVGSSALEVLDRSPGVSTDRDGNISLKGREGVLILVDGRPTHLTGADLANMLKNMNASQLDQIEIMVNPPAKYDAAGNAGVINIKMKKLLSAGYNGNFSVAVSQWRYPKSNTSFDFNYRNARINFFNSFSHNYRKTFQNLSFQRNLYDAGNVNITQRFEQETERVNHSNSFNLRTGLDFFANKTTTLGLMVNLVSTPAHMDNTSSTGIYDASKNLLATTHSDIRNVNDWNNKSLNLNFRKLTNAKGAELTGDFDLMSYRAGISQYIVNNYYSKDGGKLREADTLSGSLPQQIDVISGKLDYVHLLKNGSRIEAGIKSSSVRTDNDIRYDSIINGEQRRDLTRSNHFIYKETIQAGYLSYNKTFSKKLSAQLGLRAENTSMNGRQITTAKEFTREYFQVFPTAFVQYKASEANTYSASVGRRIKRPGYIMLNPFARFVDRYMFSAGNPELKPSISNNIELSHSWKNKILTSLSYSHTKDVVDEIIEQRGELTFTGAGNIASLDYLGLNVSTNLPITKWWTSNLNFNIYRNWYKGQIANAPIALSATSFILTGSQQFRLSSKTSAELNGRLRNGWYEGVLKTRPIGFIGIGFSRQIMSGNGMLRLALRDPFYSQKFRGSSRYGNVDFSVQDISETRLVSIGFSYRFSKGKKSAPVKRTTGSAAEEKERVGQ